MTKSKQPKKHPLNVALAQIPLHYLKPEENIHTLDILLKDMEPMEDNPIDLLILPEMWNTELITGDEEIDPEWYQMGVDWMREKAIKYDMAIYGSLICLENGKRYNRGVWIYPDGEMVTYDKVHLFGPGKENKHLTSGSKRVIVEYKEWKIFLTICYDIRFPVWNRWTPEHDYDMLVCVASWPQVRRLPWKTLLKARATENLCYVLACNRVGIDHFKNIYCGDSMIIDPRLSKIVKHHDGEMAIFTSTIYREDVDKMRQNFPTLRDADSFTLH